MLLVQKLLDTLNLDRTSLANVGTVHNMTQKLKQMVSILTKRLCSLVEPTGIMIRCYISKMLIEL